MLTAKLQLDYFIQLLCTSDLPKNNDNLNYKW